MRACLVYERHKAHQVRHLSVLAEGLRSHGVSVALGDTYREADLCVVWGAKGVPHPYERVCRLEAGYINGSSGAYIKDRLRFTSISWGELHGRGMSPPDCPSDRWDDLKIKLVPWITPSENSLLLCCLNHPHDATAPRHDWWLDYPHAMIRKHPLIEPDQEPLSQILKRVSSCVTWNSTAGIETLIAGIPTTALDRGSMVYSYSNSPGKSRKQWAQNLAYRQWTLAELQSGEAWEFARYGMETN